MNRYIVFFGDYYYPKAGAEDIAGVTDDLDNVPSIIRDALQAGRKDVFEYRQAIKEKSVAGLWWHVYDTVTYKIILSQEDSPGISEKIFEHDC